MWQDSSRYSDSVDPRERMVWSPAVSRRVCEAQLQMLKLYKFAILGYAVEVDVIDCHVMQPPEVGVTMHFVGPGHRNGSIRECKLAQTFLHVLRRDEELVCLVLLKRRTEVIINSKF